MTSRPAPSARHASRKAADAADRLLDWLKQQDGLPHGSNGRPAEPGHAAGDAAEAPDPGSPLSPNAKDAERGLDEGPGQERGAGRSLTHWVGRSDQAAQTAAAPRPQRNRRYAPRHTDWLHHHLLVAGPAGPLADFQAAARGSGTVPWRLDLDRTEEDLFLLLVAPPPPQRRRLSLAGARTLAGQLREAAERRHAAAVARVGRSQACPFDLHALVPVPDDVLCWGPDHPEALAWLWVHWGTTVALRHVAAGPVLPRRPAPDEPATLHLSFWSADWTPWRALAAVAARWPALRFDTRPTYGLL